MDKVSNPIYLDFENAEITDQCHSFHSHQTQEIKCRTQ